MGLSEISHNPGCKVRDQSYAVARALGTASLWRRKLSSGCMMERETFVVPESLRPGRPLLHKQ